MSEFKVTIEYKNKNLETVVKKEYDFIDYTEMLNLELKRILMDVEDVFYYFSGNKQKQDWSPELTERFARVRHKILDEANAIKRLPENLTYHGVKANTISFSEFLARSLK